MIRSSIKIDQLLICDLAFYSKEGKLNLIGIFENILVPQIPYSHSKICVVGFVSGGTESKTQVFLSVNDPTGKSIVPPQPINLVFNTFGQTHFRFELINFPIQSEGSYKISISDSKTEIAKTTLFIKKTGVSN
jgi:hypothetical protein